MILKILFFSILFSISSVDGRILPKSDSDNPTSSQSVAGHSIVVKNLTTEKLNPIQRRYSALSDMLRRRANLLEKLKSRKNTEGSVNTGTVFDTIEGTEGSADDNGGLGDYDYPLRDRKRAYAYHMRSNADRLRTTNMGYGIIFTARG